MSAANANGRARRVAFVMGTTTGGIGRHVRMLATGCAARGIAVEVFGPSSAAAALGFRGLPGVVFTAVEFGDRPRPGDIAAMLRLRRALRSGVVGARRDASGDGKAVVGAPDSRAANISPDANIAPDNVDVSADTAAASAADVVHAHGLRAGALTVLALAGSRGRRPAIVVTVHNAPPRGGGVPALIYRALEQVVARGADLVLCVSGDLEQRMRAAGARRVAMAIVPAPDADKASAPATAPTATPTPTPASTPIPTADTISTIHPTTAGHTTVSPAASPAAVSPAAGGGRPVVFAAGRLAEQKGFGTLLEAAASWRDMRPVPLLMIAGDGPLSGKLRAKAASLSVDAEFLGHRADLPALLAAAAVFVLPSLWEGQPLVLQEALRAGVPIVATRAGGIPDLTGDDAAVLVPPGNPGRLASAVRSVLVDPALAARLRAAALSRAAELPSQDDAVAAALACYAEALR